MAEKKARGIKVAAAMLAMVLAAAAPALAQATADQYDPGGPAP